MHHNQIIGKPSCRKHVRFCVCVCVCVCVWERERERDSKFLHASTSFTSKSSVCARQGFPYVAETELDPFKLQEKKIKIVTKLI